MKLKHLKTLVICGCLAVINGCSFDEGVSPDQSSNFQGQLKTAIEKVQGRSSGIEAIKIGQNPFDEEVKIYFDNLEVLPCDANLKKIDSSVEQAAYIRTTYYGISESYAASAFQVDYEKYNRFKKQFGDWKDERDLWRIANDMNLVSSLVFESISIVLDNRQDSSYSSILQQADELLIHNTNLKESDRSVLLHFIAIEKGKYIFTHSPKLKCFQWSNYSECMAATDCFQVMYNMPEWWWTWATRFCLEFL